jgi:branched-chain amino acid transport system substrate-binding protein
VIGQVTSLTGPNYMGLENRDGAQLAVRQLNDRGGLLGRRVELRVEDDASLPTGAVDGYHRLADQEVTAVVGTSFSNASLAVLPHTDDRKVVYVSTGAAHTQVDPVRPYVFMTPPTGRLVAAQLLRYFREHGLSRVAVVFDSDSVFNREAWATQATMLSEFGIEVVTVESVKVDTRDFGPTVAAIAHSGAQALMAWVTGPPATGLALAFRSAGLSIPMVAGIGAASPAFVDEVGPRRRSAP